MKTGTTANWNENGTAEIAKLEREPYFKIEVDWTGTVEDITDEVTRLSWRQEYEDEVLGQVPAGARSGDCDIELATGSKYSYFNTSSPLYGTSRLNKDVTVDAGFDASGTSQYLRSFTGKTHSLSVKASERSTSLHCVDPSEALRSKKISLPLMQDIRSDNLIRYILSESGVVTLYGVSAVDANTAWAVGASGVILYTTDAGANWTSQTSGVATYLYSVSAVDANTAWAVGDDGTIRFSDDGTSWSGQSFPDITVPSFTDPGFEAGSGETFTYWNVSNPTYVKRTSDNKYSGSYSCSIRANLATREYAYGKSTNRATINPLASYAVKIRVWGNSPLPTHWRVQFYNAGGDYLGSKDSGDFVAPQYEWTQKTINIGPGDYPSGTAKMAIRVYGTEGDPALMGVLWDAITVTVTDYPKDLGGVCAIAADNILAVGEYGTIIKSADGTTWSYKVEPSDSLEDLNAIDAVDATHIWAVGDNGRIRFSSDGTDWSNQSSGTSEDLYGVYALDSTHVWAAGDNGTILFYDGASWSTQDASIEVDLYDVYAADSTHIWAVGGAGTLLFSDGTAWSMCEDEVKHMDTGYNTISYAYLDNVNAWEAIKKICEAEGASAYFDAEGEFHFENRYHLLGVGHNTSAKTISYDSDVEDLSLSEDIEGVVNRCVVKASPLEKKDGGDIWSAQTEITIPRNGTKVFHADLTNPAVGIDTSFTGTTGTGQSRFQACYYKKIGTTDYYFDMTGSVGLYATAYGKSVEILGTNKRTDKDAILCGTDGNPYVYIYGSEIAPAESTSGSSKIYAVAEDEDSMSLYGTRTLEIENPYIDSFTYAQNMAQYTVMMYKDPLPKLDGLTIMADPRLELGDRVTVQDSSDVTGIDNEFWVTGIDSSLDDGYKQKLKVEYAPLSSVFILDHATQGKLDCNVLAF